jgi:hypothetical protein
MNSLAARLRDEDRDNMGADEARAAAEALTAAARAVLALDGAESRLMLIGLQRRINAATVTLEEVCDRQLSVAIIRLAGYVEGYAAGLAARGLHSVR